MTDEKLVENIMDTLQAYNLPYEDRLSYYHAVKERLEEYYRMVADSDLTGKDLICDYISEYRDRVEGKIRIKELTGNEQRN